MILKEKILFTKEECESIISYNETDITNWRMGDRKYNSQPINYSLETKWLFDKLKDFVERETKIEIKTIKKTVHFHKFTKGDWFGKHNDIRDDRVYAVGALLNDDFNGGDFKLYNPTELTLNKLTGNTYIFDVKIEHEITPILNGERYSLLWFLQYEHIKIQTNKLI
jgi:hypothetical protein